MSGGELSSSFARLNDTHSHLAPVIANLIVDGVKATAETAGPFSKQGEGVF
jgi:hypothetical protein